MFNFQVWPPYKFLGNPAHHAILECDDVVYIVLFSNGRVIY